MKDTLIAFYIILCVGIIGCSFLVYSLMYALFLLCVFIFMYIDLFNKNRSNVAVFLIALLKLYVFLFGGYLYVEHILIDRTMVIDLRFTMLVFYPGIMYFLLGLPFLLLRRKKRML